MPNPPPLFERLDMASEERLLERCGRPSSVFFSVSSMSFEAADMFFANCQAEVEVGNFLRTQKNCVECLPSQV